MDSRDASASKKGFYLMVIFTKKFGTLDPHLPIVWDKVPQKKRFFLHLPLWTKLYSDPGLQDFYDFYDMTEHCCSLRSSVTGRGGIARFPSGGINFTGGRSTRCKRPPDRVAYHSEADHQTESSVMHMG